MMRFFPILAVGLALVRLLYPQDQLQVGYSVFVADPTSPLPFATALFSYRNAEGILVWEAGVEATQPMAEGLIFVDQRLGSRTGLALVNISDAPVSVSLQLRDSDGFIRADLNRQFQAFEQLSIFVDELFPGMSQDLTGTLRFLSEDQSPRLAAITLRQNSNPQGEAVFATLPVTEVSEVASAQSLIFPHVGAGNGLSTEIVLINPGQGQSSGMIRFISSSGTPLEFDIDGTLAAEVPYQIDPMGTFHILLQRSFVGVGYAVLTPEETSSTPAGSALFQYRQEERVISEAGVAALPSTTWARIHIDNAGTRTGLAIANPGNMENTLTFELLDRGGVSLATAERRLAPQGHSAMFSDELFPELPPGFIGVMDIRSNQPFVPITLKLTVNQRKAPIVTTLPVADLLNTNTSDSAIFPQIGFGNGFTTRFILLSPGSIKATSGTLLFRRSDGTDMILPIQGGSDSQFSLRIASGGGADIRPGTVASVRGQIYDAVTEAPISGALIWSSLDSIQAVSDSNGDFVLYTELSASVDLQPYTLRICATGYDTLIQSLDGPNQPEALEFFLIPADNTACRGQPRVTVIGASIPQDEIRLVLSPLAVQGTLKLEAIGPEVSHLILQRQRFSGLQVESFEVGVLPVGEFTHLRATWTVGGSSGSSDFPHRFKVLGNYLHTRYNIPNEENCSGTLSPFCHNEGDCQVTQCLWRTDGMGKSGWLSEAKENGSGFSTTLGFVSLEWFCTPPAECTTAFRNLTEGSACPACPGGSLVEDLTVAVRPDHPDLACGDQVFIEGVGVRTVTDNGQLPSLQQLDHFAGVSGCNVPASIGRRPTIKLYE